MDPSETDAEGASMEDRERYLDRFLAKTESAKADLDKNWLAQITSITLSVALIAGLGETVARKLFDDPARYQVLFLVLPAVNTYLFVRFGLLGTVFSKARFNTEVLACALPGPRLKGPKPAGLDMSYLYRTNSYFEWVHEPSRGPALLFLLTIPLVFALNHALTLYMLYKVVGLTPALLLLGLGYAFVVGACYAGYYKANHANTPVFKGPGNRFIILTALFAIAATAVLLFALAAYDPTPGRLRQPPIPPAPAAPQPPHA